MNADVVIIGGGVIGASIAFHLAQKKAGRVVVVERGERIGEGSTGRATGGFRAQFASEINVRLSLLSRQKLRNFAGEVGGESGYWPRGYLFLASDDAVLATLVRAQQVQHACGLNEAVELTHGEVLELQPEVDPASFVGAVFCPTDGFIRPMSLLASYTDAAERLGVTFLYDEEVIAADADGDVVSLIRTKQRAIATRLVINAAGAWAGVVGEALGTKIPVTPLKRHVAATFATDVLPPEMPMTIYPHDGFHMRVREGRVLLVRPHEGVTSFDQSFDEQWLQETVRVARSRVPVLRRVEVDPDACWSGLYEMSPDRHLIFGRSVEKENVLLANGSSGHGVMHSPAIGQLMAELVVEGRTSLDMFELRASRFGEGAAIESPSLL